MARLACFSVPSLPLQIALRRHPPKTDLPIALVRDDRPSSPILQLNLAARRQGLRSALRYGEALALVANLKAEVVSRADVQGAQDEIGRVLSRWSPHIEPCPFERGTFWLDPSGLSGLFGTEAEWATAVVASLSSRRYQANFAIGSSRGGTFVLARTKRSSILRSAEAERKAWEASPLSLLPMGPRDRRRLRRLGLQTLGDLARLSPADLLRRFDRELVDALRAMDTAVDLPIQALAPVVQPTFRCRFEPAETDVSRMLRTLLIPFEAELTEVQRRGQLLAELRLVFVFESGRRETEVLRPASPSTLLRLWSRLLDLRLSERDFSEATVEVRATWTEAAPPPFTGELFASVERDLRRGEEALAMLRAKFGNQAVVRAALSDSHLPEASFRWQVAETLAPPQPRPLQPKTGVRRIFLEPRRANPSGVPLTPALRLTQPSGLDKEYWFLRRGDEILWVSKDLASGETRIEGVLD